MWLWNWSDRRDAKSTNYSASNVWEILKNILGHALHPKESFCCMDSWSDCTLLNGKGTRQKIWSIKAKAAHKFPWIILLFFHIWYGLLPPLPFSIVTSEFLWWMFGKKFELCFVTFIKLIRDGFTTITSVIFIWLFGSWLDQTHPVINLQETAPQHFF